MPKLIDLVKGLSDNPTAEEKQAILKAAEAFKTQINKENQLTREGLAEEMQAKLDTEKETVKNLQSTIENLKKEAKEGNTKDIQDTIDEYELKLKAEQDKNTALEGKITEYTLKDEDAKLTKYAEKLLGDVDMEFKEDHINRIKKGLVKGTEDGVFLAKDELGNKILAETFRDSYLEKNKKYIKDPGAGTGGSDNTGGNQSNTGGLPQNRSEYDKLSRDSKLKLKSENPDHVRKILTT